MLITLPDSSSELNTTLPRAHHHHLHVCVRSIFLLWSVLFIIQGPFIHTYDKKKHFTANQIKKEKIESPMLNEVVLGATHLLEHG